MISFKRDHSFQAVPGCHHLVSGSFHPPLGVLFNFPSRYYYTIGLETYLELGVDAPQIHAGFPTDATQELDPIFSTYIYGAFTLYGMTFQSISTSLKKIVNQVFLHHISPSFHKGIQFVLCRVRSTLLTASLLLSFPPPTKMFQFGGFPLLTEHPKIGSPIR